MFWIIRYAASVSQLLQLNCAPRGARISREGSKRESANCNGFSVGAFNSGSSQNGRLPVDDTTRPVITQRACEKTSVEVNGNNELRRHPKILIKVVPDVTNREAAFGTSLALLAVNMLFRVLFQVWSGSLRELLIRPKQCVKRCLFAHKIADLINGRLSVSDYDAARDPSRMSGMAGLW